MFEAKSAPLTIKCTPKTAHNCATSGAIAHTDWRPYHCRHCALNGISHKGAIAVETDSSEITHTHTLAYNERVSAAHRRSLRRMPFHIYIYRVCGVRLCDCVRCVVLCELAWNQTLVHTHTPQKRRHAREHVGKLRSRTHMLRLNQQLKPSSERATTHTTQKMAPPNVYVKQPRE